MAIDFDSALSSSTESSAFRPSEQSASALANEVVDLLKSSWKSISPPLDAISSVAQNILGDFALFDGLSESKVPPATQEKDAREKALLGNPWSIPAKKENDWTVMVQLDASVGKSKPDAGKNGTDNDQDKKVFGAKAEKLKQITDMAQKTVGKSMAVVVQISYTDETDNKTYLERYVIKNGDIQPNPDKAKQLRTESEGSAKDIESLERFALDQEPAKRIALIDNVHGQGNGGTKGDTDGRNGMAGLSTVQANDLLADAILAGLEGSGHDQLDLLDMDACMMGQDGFLRAAAAVTDNLVASAEKELAPGQDIGKMISNLAENTSVDGCTFAHEIIDSAENGDNVNIGFCSEERQGTNTLAYYDLSKLDQFDQNLNRFDQDLLNYVKWHPEDREILAQAFKSAKGYGDNYHAKRDLKQILDGIKELIETGEIEDADGILSQDIAFLLTAEDQLVNDYFADTKRDAQLSGTGGLSIYVPAEGEVQTERQRKGSLKSWRTLIDALGLSDNC